MDTPIYDELAAKYGVSIPDPLEASPLSSLLPVTDAATPTMAIPVVHPADDDPAAAFPPEDQHQHGRDLVEVKGVE